LRLAVAIEEGLFFIVMNEIKIIDIKIDDLNIDLSDKVYYYAKIEKNKKYFICQMVTDGIINPHLNIKEWSDYVKNYNHE
tara:strand:- start:354 stop:593 length:240 start_codon:yes stop_codon:yes gene_type:complete